MSGIIKNQILKQLSKFAKNLNADKINISTLKGEGELSNLELNEEILMQLLDLPSWLILTKAVCNKINVKIQWTKLKSQPICLYLDEVEIVMETCPELRKPSPSTSATAALNSGGKYGFSEKIIDGITLHINSVTIKFHAKAFSASFQMSRIVVRSKTPKWNVTNDLRNTRVKDETRGEVLTFKEAEWLSLRIEANALEGAEAGLLTTPLRLISNQAKIRISIKKRLSDCSIIASRVSVLLDDLLWVLTDLQLKAALIFVNSVRDIIKKASLQSKQLAAEKLKKQGHLSAPSQPAAAGTNPKPVAKMTSREQIFAEHNLVETSYHLYTGRIDLHLCDDAAPAEHELANSEREKGTPHKVEGGALQITLHKLSFDHYPYHPNGTSRSHWMNFDPDMKQCEEWCGALVQQFKTDVRKVRDIFVQSQHSKSQTTANDVEAVSTAPSNENIELKSVSATSPSTTTNSNNEMKMSLSLHGFSNISPTPAAISAISASRSAHLLESCVVVRLEDFAVYRVSTATDSRRHKPRKFFASDKRFHHLPADAHALHVELTDYYFPEGIDYPLPPSAIYVELNPIKFVLDFLTVTWLNVFALNLWANVDMQLYSGVVLPEEELAPYHADIRLSMLMPRFIIPEEDESRPPCHPSYPCALLVNLSKVTFTNVRSGDGVRDAVRSALNRLQTGVLFREFVGNSEPGFPCSRGDLGLLPPHFDAFVNCRDGAYFDKNVEQALYRGQISNQTNSELSGSFYNRPNVPQDAVIISTATSKQSSSASSAGPNTPVRADNVVEVSEYGLTYHSLRANSLRTHSAMDVWCMSVEQLWVTFVTSSERRFSRPVPFVESFPVTVWLLAPWTLPTDDATSQKNKENHSRCEDLLGMSDSHSTTNGENQKEVETNNDKAVSTVQSAKFHAIVKFGSKINAQINHYQYVFLMRLVDSLVACKDEVLADMDTIQQKNKAATAPVAKQQDDKQSEDEELSFGVSLLIDDCELAMVFPPLPADIPSQLHSMTDFRGEDQSNGDVHDDATTNSDPLTRDSTVHDLANIAHSVDDKTATLSAASIVLMKSASESQLPMLVTPSANLLDETLLQIHERHAHSTGTSSGVWSAANNLSLTGSTPAINLVEPPPSESRARNPIHSTSDTMLLSRTIDGAKAQDSTPPSSLVSSRSNGGSSSGGVERDGDLRKGFGGVLSKSFTRIGRAMKQTKRDLLDVHDDEETDGMSMKSSLSSDEDEDSFQIIQREETEAPAFESRRNRSDDSSSVVCSDTMDDNAESISTYNSEKSHTIVSVVTFKLSKVEVGVQAKGDNVAAMVVVGSVQPNEMGNWSLDKFQAEFASEVESYNKRTATQSENNTSADSHDSTTHPSMSDAPIRVRFQVGVKAEDQVEHAGDKGLLVLRLQRLALTLNSSSVDNISELIRDNTTADPELTVPLQIFLENSDIVLKNDRKPQYIGLGPAEPLQLHLTSALVSRRADGIFNIQAGPIPAPGASAQKSEAAVVIGVKPKVVDVAALAINVSATSTESATDPAVNGNYDDDDLGLLKSSKVKTEDKATDCRDLPAEDEEVSRSKEQIERQDVMIEQMKEQADLIVAMKLERENLMRLVRELQDEVYAAELERQ